MYFVCLIACQPVLAFDRWQEERNQRRFHDHTDIVTVIRVVPLIRLNWGFTALQHI